MSRRRSRYHRRNNRATLPALVLLGALAALVAAYTAQYGFGLQPCILCLYQRIPFGMAALLALLTLLLGGAQRGPLMLLAGLALLANTGLAVFHTGVELHWWAGTEACAGGAAATAGMTMEQLQQALAQPAQPRCDQPPWSFHGITMANLNIPFSLALALLALWGMREPNR